MGQREAQVGYVRGRPRRPGSAKSAAMIRPFGTSTAAPTAAASSAAPAMLSATQRNA